MNPRQQRDLDLWKEWKKTNSPAVLQQLLSGLAPLLNREISKWDTTVPRPALESKARLLAVEALKNYDPSRGAAVGTHVASRIRKLSRHVYPYQNVARLPENQQLLYNTFQVAQNRLVDSLGRDPTHEELADELAWTPKKVTDFQKAFGRRELVESEGAQIYGDEEDTDSLVDFYYHGLNPLDQRLFEDITGYGTSVALSNAQLRRKHRLSQGQLSYRKRKFIDELKRIQQGKI
jgi:DNA-directed RNA polymerase specialized sigma subunit